ncbi:A.superbus venom factor 1 [Parasteatoda tepidariorum]
MNSLSFIVLICLLIIPCLKAQTFYLTAPSTLRLDSDETIAIAVEGKDGALVNVYIQDFPGKIKNITQTVLEVWPGRPEIFKINLNPAAFPADFFKTNPTSEKYVSLIVNSQQFQKEIQIPITNKAGYVFIQTDKPIYTPKQKTAHIRIIPLNEDALPSNKPFKLQIRNPQNVVVEETFFDRKSRRSQKVFISHIYKFPTFPVLGEWAATVNYGHELQQNSTVHFELQEYVLPTFTVDLKAPEVILESDETITASVQAKFVYGKKVNGLVTFRLGVKQMMAAKQVFFAVIGPKELDDGSYTLRLDTKNLAHHKDIGWFPEIEGSHLVVEATVVDNASGNKEVATDSRGIFAKSPFSISFKRCLQDFKPGLVSVFEADINFVDGRPAVGVPTILRAVAKSNKDNSKELKVTQTNAVSDDEGKVSFELQPEIHHETVSITIETDDPRYVGNQAVGHFEQHKFKSTNEAYVAIERSSSQKLKVDDMFVKVVHFEPGEIQNTYYTVSAKGKIILQKPFQQGQVKVQRVEFVITQDMVPNFRLTVFAHYKDELLVDSLNIDVENTCNKNAEVSIVPEFDVKEPGNNGKIVIRGTKATLVGLLGVDEAVYALSKKDLLTRSKVFKELAKHDLGCGPGGGIDSDKVLANAGLIMASNVHNPSSTTSSCVAIKRRKREIGSEILSDYSGLAKECCSLGMSHDSQNRDCETRTNIVVRQLKGEHSNCSRAFLECCQKAKERGFTEMKAMKAGMHLARMGAIGIDEPNFVSLDEEEFFEKGLMVRSDFRETWFAEDIIIGPDNQEVFDVSLPHSITTWAIQAVSVSPNYGICVAEPQKIVSTKKVFLQLNLPYSVVRNEQTEVQATLFNYGTKKLAAVVYMYGVKDVCSGANEGEKSERKRLIVDPQSAMTTTFPVIPLKEGMFNLKVVALSPEGSDVILKTLNVIPEGYLVEVDIPIKLDPTNQQRRAKRHITNDLFSDSIDTSQNLQVTAIKLPVPKDFVPGTESCTITALGYGNQLSYRKDDGSYSAWNGKPTSTWLTAFVMKVFCQANKMVHIDEDVLCSGVKWLVSQQQPDGSFVENNPVYHIEMTGGVQGSIPMTAFVLIALEECECDIGNLLITKKRAVAYLEDHLGEVNDPLPIAVVAYALTLGESALKQAAYDRVVSIANYNEDKNEMHLGSGETAENIEATAYALLNLLLFDDLTRGNSIVNWLNTQRLQSGSFKSTQDTVVALQALSEYAMRAQLPSVNLVANISSSNDRNFHKVLSFTEQNAHILQDIKVNKIGGMLFVNTGGHGIGSLSVKLRYNVLHSAEKMCKFDVSVNATEIKKEKRVPLVLNPKGKDLFERFPPDLIRGVQEALDLKDDVPVIAVDPRNRKQPLVGDREALIEKVRNKRENQMDKLQNSKLMLKVLICVRYLGSNPVGMSIVDVGIFSGFQPNRDDLIELQEDPNHLIERYEISSKGVVFYLKTVPSRENYCFDFHVTREYMVGKTQASIVKVYDYYNPDEACSAFYGPGNNSPLLHTLCDGGVCQCAEGGCPPQHPFEEVKKYNDPSEIRDKLRDIACDNYDYVWKGKLDGEIKKENGFLNISFVVEEVIKEGIEKAELIEGDIRSFLSRDVCDSAKLFPQQTYLIMGMDGQKYKNEHGQIWHRYLLDKKSAIHLWTLIKEAKDKPLQRALNHVVRKLKSEGCAQ